MATRSSRLRSVGLLAPNITCRFVSWPEEAHQLRTYLNVDTPARHCGHCCMDKNNAYDKYNRATKQFHQSIALVQRLLGQGWL